MIMFNKLNNYDENGIKMLKKKRSIVISTKAWFTLALFHLFKTWVRLWESQQLFLFSDLSQSRTRRVQTYPTKRHHVESVSATVELIKEVTVGVLGGVINLQLAAWSPVEEMQINIVKLCTQGMDWCWIYKSKLSTTDHMLLYLINESCLIVLPDKLMGTLLKHHLIIAKQS